MSRIGQPTPDPARLAPCAQRLAGYGRAARPWKGIGVDLSPFDLARLSLYLSGLATRPAQPAAAGAEPGVVTCGASETRRHIFRRHSELYRWRDFRGARYKNYIREAQHLVRQIDDSATFAVYPGDCRTRFAQPVFVKSRLIADRDAGSVLLPLDYHRHWKDIAAVAAQDIPFEDKTNTLVWRGGTTGQFRHGIPGWPQSSRAHVANLPQRAGQDIGYSEIVQLEADDDQIPHAAIRARLLPPLAIAEQLRSRFLLSLEGNDVATGLKWMLWSNSTVIMPHPTCESWACEGALVPNVHYIPVRDDLSDLGEVHDWCMANLSHCADVARNGRQFIAAFLDPVVERELCRRVVSSYLAATDIPLSFGPLETLLQMATRLFRGGTGAGRSAPGTRLS